MKYITDFSEIESIQGAVVVDFWAEWCGPCKMLAPVFEAVAAKLDGKATFVKANVDEARDLATDFNVAAIPTIVVVKDGAEVARKVGYVNEVQLEAFVNEAL